MLHPLVANRLALIIAYLGCRAPSGSSPISSSSSPAFPAALFLPPALPRSLPAAIALVCDLLLRVSSRRVEEEELLQEVVVVPLDSWLRLLL